jgi:PAS domain S-box-containing protein
MCYSSSGGKGSSKCVPATGFGLQAGQGPGIQLEGEALENINRPEEQLVAELSDLRQQIVELQAAEVRHSRTEQALRDSETRYRQFVEYSPNPIFSISIEGVIQTWNRACERVFQYTAGEIVGQTYHKLFGDPEDCLVIAAHLAQVVGNRPLDDVDLCYRCKDGTRRFTVSRLYPLLNGEGSVVGCIFANTDITERRRAEEVLRQRNRELELLNRASQVFISSLNLEEVLATILEEVRQLLGVAACSAWLIDRDTGEVVCRQATGPQGDLVRGWRLAPGQGIAGWVIRTGQSAVVADAETDARYFPKVDQRTRLGIRSILSVPLRVKQDVLGTLQVVDTQVDRFSRSDLRLMQSVAGVASIVVENAWLYEETDRLRAFNENIVQSMDEGILLYNAEGLITFVNPRAADMVGYSPDELTGRHWSKIVAPECLPQVQAEVAKRSQGVASRYETTLVAKAGHPVPVIVSARPLFDELPPTEDGAPDPGDNRRFIGTLVVATDINQHKLAEEEIRRLKELNEGIVQAMAEGITIEDACGVFTFVNPAAAAMLDCAPNELLGKHWSTIVPVDQHAIVQAVNQRRAEGVADQYELQLMRRDGSRIPVLISGTPRFEDGQFAGTLAVFTDITERVKAEEELRRRNRELTLLNQIIAASASGLELEAILETACHELAHTFKVPRASVVLLNAEKKATVVVAQYLAEGQPTLVDAGESSLGKAVPVANNASFQHLLSYKAPLVISDAQGDWSLEPIHDQMRQCGIASLLSLPLIIEGEVVGSLDLEAMESRHFSVEEVSLAWSVADQLAGVLAQRRLQEQRQRLEEQYRQAQKMEVVGQLTAGIAHDFNNLLTVINGFAELMSFEVGANDPLRESMSRILDAGRRATDLVRRLLAFSRKQVIEPQVIDLNSIVAEMDKMLRRIIGENIELVTSLGADLSPVEVDPAQIEQVIINLAVNARDAMPAGGQLTIETANVVLDEAYTAHHLSVQPGKHVLLAISDTGIGMSQDIKAHLFEPFFTTKEVGKGTGLGLATVYGIVKQSGGHIWVYSEEGRGTTFKIYLPCAKGAPRPLLRQRGMADAPCGKETILLVEDDEAVRDLALRVLRGQGYTVLQARNGQEALHISAHHPHPIHLLLSDLVMPGIGGKDLAQQLVQARSGLRVLLMSGYTDQAVAHDGLLESGFAFLQKPFSPIALANKVRQALDNRQPL